METKDSRKRPWTFLTAHGMLVVYLSRHPDSTVRKISDDLDITERQVARIVKQLAEDGILRVRRINGRNSYLVVREARLRRPGIDNVPVGRFVDALSSIIEASS